MERPGAERDESLGILGYGRFGRALGELAEGAGLSWAAFDPAARVPESHAAASGREVAERCRLIAACTPVAALEGALLDLRPALTTGHLVLDVGSVKVLPSAAMARVLGPDVPWCATHPLFGPVSLERGERPLRAVVCPNRQHPGAAARARGLYERLGCEVTEMDADAHDRHMAETHALAFFVARAMLDIDAGHGSELVTPSFRAMAQTVETVRGDAGHLFSLIQLGNPHAAEARRRLIRAMEEIDRELREAGERGSAVRDIGPDDPKAS